MKHFFKHIIAILILFSVVLWGVNLFQTKYNPEPRHYAQHYDSLFFNQKKYKGIILGNSHAVHGIRPSILDSCGLQFYNFALNGAGPQFYLNWYHFLFSPNNPKPAYCIYVVDNQLFDDRWLWRENEHDAAHYPFGIFLNQFLLHHNFNKKDLVINRFPVLKFRKRMARSLAFLQGDPAFVHDEFDRGFVPLLLPKDSTRFISPVETAISTQQIACFEQLITQFTKDSIRVIFVSIPEFQTDSTIYQNQDVWKQIEKLQAPYNIPLIQFNSAQYLDFIQKKNFFADQGHLNSEGSRIFTTQLSDSLKVLIQ